MGLLPSSKISKSSRGQVGDDVALSVGDRGVDLDRVDLNAERGLAAAGGLLAGERLRAADDHTRARRRYAEYMAVPRDRLAWPHRGKVASTSVHSTALENQRGPEARRGSSPRPFGAIGREMRGPVRRTGRRRGAMRPRRVIARHASRSRGRRLRAVCHQARAAVPSACRNPSSVAKATECQRRGSAPRLARIDGDDDRLARAGNPRGCHVLRDRAPGQPARALGLEHDDRLCPPPSRPRSLSSLGPEAGRSRSTTISASVETRSVEVSVSSSRRRSGA